MPEYEFDVDASINAGWGQFASDLADLLRDLAPGDTFDIAVPVLGSPASRTPYIRFFSTGPDRLRAEVSSGDHDDPACRLGADQLAQLTALGWEGATSRDSGGPDPTSADRHITASVNNAERTAHLVAGTLERVFGIPHPVFLHDAMGPTRPAHTESDATLPEHPDFQPIEIASPDEATRAVGTALAEVYAREVPADEHDVFAVPAGSALLFVRAHRSLPLVVFRSPLVSSVQNVAAAETEIAILNRDSLWCRYVFDGETIYAESEFVDRVFVPVNFKIQLSEVAAELDDVDGDLARRVAGKRWLDLHAAEEHWPGEQ